MAKTLNQKLLEVSKELRGLTEKFDTLIAAMGVLKESGAGPAKKASKKKPAAKKAAPKKAIAKKPAITKSAQAKKSAKKVTKKAVPKKKAKTALETVLMLIKRTKKGITTEALMKKTGFGKKKISNTVYKLKKQGKIVVAERGKYVKA